MQSFAFMEDRLAGEAACYVTVCQHGELPSAPQACQEGRTDTQIGSIMLCTVLVDVHRVFLKNLQAIVNEML